MTKTTDHLTKETAVEVNNLRIGFNSHQVLKNISLQLLKGENLVVLGRSGSGKSVLAKCIVGLLQPEAGNIWVLGKNITELDIKELNELRKKMGYLFQSGALYDSMTVRENLEFQLKRIQRNLTKEEVSRKINEALDNVGLRDALNKMPAELSGGMRKRIGLARTIVAQPVILLYDEPTTGLDPVTSEEISNLINDIKNKYSTSSLIITHDIRCVKTVADRILILDDGVIYMEGNYQSFNSSEDPLVKQFFK